MALETGTYISDLVSTNPVGTDTLDKADDHLRLIKSTLQATFPSITGAVTASHADLNAIDGMLDATNGRGFLRNRILNGDCRIDQRNAGASVTPTAQAYVLDRWNAALSVSSKYSVQQNAGSVTPPSGFANYLGVTSLSAYVLTGNDSFSIQQIIEGYNVSDLNWGAASASPATLSFWVRSSLTGTFGGSIATTKTAVWVMPFTYTISSANTWTYITVSITAPTGTGGTNNDNTAGIYVRFGLGATGVAAGGTAGTWTNAGNYVQPSGTVSVVGTNAATWYITGVQLEAGSVATPFERRQYGQELALCQRYYHRITGGNSSPLGSGQVFAATQAVIVTNFPVTMRTSPTALEQTGTASNYKLYQANTTVVACSSVPAFNAANTLSASTIFNASTLGGTAGQATYALTDGTGYFGWSAEL